MEHINKPSEKIFWWLFCMWKNEGENNMDDTYTLLNKFECCGTTMVIVMIKGKAACVMTETEYNKIIGIEWKSREK